MVASTSYFHYDGHGNVDSVTDESGAVQNKYRYTAFGETTTVQENVTNNFKYVGELGYYSDSTTGENYVRARTYSPTQARWLSRDPIGLAGGDVNLYRYVGGNPTNAVDPSGKSELSAAQYRKYITSLINAGETDIDTLFQKTLKHYWSNDPEDDWCWDCEDDMEEVFEAFGDLAFDRTLFGKGEEKGAFVFKGLGQTRSDLTVHFFAGAAISASVGGFFGSTAGVGKEFYDEFRKQFSDHKEGFSVLDVKYTAAGAWVPDYFDVSEKECRRRVKKFIDGQITISQVAISGSKTKTTGENPLLEEKF